MSEGGRFVSPMTRESLPPNLAPADEQREAAATFRRERSAAMLAFTEEAAGLDGRQEMAMSVTSPCSLELRNNAALSWASGVVALCFALLCFGAGPARV